MFSHKKLFVCTFSVGVCDVMISLNAELKTDLSARHR